MDNGSGDNVFIELKERECDEAKCRNFVEGYSRFISGHKGYTCWAPLASNEETLEGSYPHPSPHPINNTSMPTTASQVEVVTNTATCADGLEPVFVEDAPTMEGWTVNVTYAWYTCCAPISLQIYDSHREAEDVAVRFQTPRQQCSDSPCMRLTQGDDCWGDTLYEPMTCYGPTEFRYPRKTGADAILWGAPYSQYVCCSSPGADGSPPLQNAFSLQVVRVSSSLFALAACLLVICGVLSSKKTRGNSYNLYLVFLSIPDVVFTCFSLVAGALTLRGVHIKLFWVLCFQLFHGMGNLWVNALVSLQIYRLLAHSHQRRKTGPPTVRNACLQGTAVCLWAAIFAVSVTVLSSPLVTLTPKGAFVVWVASNVIVLAPPFLCFTFVFFQIWWRKLLPRSGRTRVLSLYYMRIIFVYFVFWFPGTIFFVVSTLEVSPAFNGPGYFIFALLNVMLQIIASAAVALSKPDVAAATRDFLGCRCDSVNKREEENNELDNTTRQWWSFKPNLRNAGTSRLSSLTASNTSAVVSKERKSSPRAPSLVRSALPQVVIE